MRSVAMRNRLEKNRIDQRALQRVLILNQNTIPCAIAKCNDLVAALKNLLPNACVHQEREVFHLTKVPFIPNLVLLRISIDQPAAVSLIATCKMMWRYASILAIACAVSDNQDDNSRLFRSVDDFVFCPFPESELIYRVKRLLYMKDDIRLLGLSDQRQKLAAVAVVGESSSFLRVVEKIPLLAGCDAAVLISGETGSGKEVMARAIHYQGARSGKPFIPINCGALPDHLFENELFGHVKGAFTDASATEKGLIGEAEGGTLFLDEVDALSPSAQIKLLRFLQDGEYRPVGSSRSMLANVRVIAATNADLAQRIKAQLFREDLYFRLNALSVTVPPLRERTQDIVHLCDHFLTEYAREHSAERRGISRDAVHKLMAYEWPGNIRELESVILRALILTTSVILQPEDISLPQRKPAQGNTLLRQAKTRVIQSFELNYLTDLLASHRGNISHAAMAAGKQRSALQRLVRKYSLNPKSFRV